jgi:tyrosinase
VATSSSSPVTLTGKTESVAVPVQQEARPRLAPAFAEVPDTRVILNIQGIQLEKQPGVYYEVYVNLPPGAAPDFQSIYYAGNLPFFGFEAHADHAGPEGGSHSFDITALARELKAQNQWNEGNVAVTFVPRGLVGATGQTAAAPQATPPVKVGKITLTSEE